MCLDERIGAGDDALTAPEASTTGPEAPERGPLRVRVYIDGFNLYFGCLQGTPYRWLDVASLARHLLDPVLGPYVVAHVRYFTAPVLPRAGDTGTPDRQRLYIRALRSLNEVSIHFGTYRSRTKSYPLADGTGFAEVVVMEEKGSDVNLASHLIIDASAGLFDVALVISNDTDLVEPIRLVRSRFRLRVGVAAPCFRRDRKPHHELERAADFTAHILRRNQSCLKASQFPHDLLLPDGSVVSCPDAWR